MNVLGIETSCDETSAAVVSDGRQVLSNVVLSQVKLHSPYGGVVPEIASRSHVENLHLVVDRAINESGLEWNELDRIAVTSGPGLASSLLIGISFAKGLAMRMQLPLYSINHLHAHVYSVFLEEDAPIPGDVTPFIALVVSGGHTSLVRFVALDNYELLGQTIDDAAGEAFDKGAKLLNLGYPGGPVIDRMAKNGDSSMVRFPRGRQRKSEPCGGLDPELCFSFSGLKTALLYHLKKHPEDKENERISSIAASYQEAIIDSIVERCEKAIRTERHLVVAGGVSLNSRLRDRLNHLCSRLGIHLLLPRPVYCTDNAAMIAGYCGANDSLKAADLSDLDANPNMTFHG